MARAVQRLKIYKAAAPTVEVTALAVGDEWISEPVPALGALAFLALLNSTNGDGSTLGMTTLVAQVSVSKAFTVPVTIGAGTGVMQNVVTGSPCFLIGGQVAEWLGAGNIAHTPIGCPWPFFRLSGTADAATGLTTGLTIDLMVVTDNNR